MDYLLTFLEGIITFISPCLLPMLPIYISYIAGQDHEARKKAGLVNAAGFVLGFTLVFVLMGAFAGTVGSWLREYRTAVNLIAGIIVIIFGLNYLGVIRLPQMNAQKAMSLGSGRAGWLAAVTFGIVFAVGWTPCVGAFLGSALMLAASGGESLKGVLLLLSFSLGLGIPFLISAVLINRLKSTLNWIKTHHRLIHAISGGLLVVVGILMATGLFGYWLDLLTIRTA